jgi:hypothetical protein
MVEWLALEKEEAPGRERAMMIAYCAAQDKRQGLPKIIDATSVAISSNEGK